jgi:uncharacterized protein (TIGR02147 family)
MQVQTPLPFPEAQVREPVIGAYTDFRDYLRDFYDYKLHLHRNSFSSYNYKTFSAAADIKSPNYLKLIIEGERNLSPATARKFAKALGLDREGTDEFLLLVEYGQALDPLERNRHLKALNEFRTRRRIRSGELTDEKVEGAPKWVSWVLHALADQKNADFSIDGLRDLLQGKVSADDIRRSLQQLLDSQSLVLDTETGKIKKGLVPPTQEEIPPEMIRKIQSELMYLGMEALLNGKNTDREIGTLTVCLTEAEFEKIKFELRHLRKRILKDALVNREQGPGDRVYQLNIQMYPLTKKAKPAHQR